MFTQIFAVADRVREGFKSGKTLPLGYRVKQLQQLASFLTSEREGLLGALKADFKSHYEALSELRTVETEVVRAIDEISKWNRPQSLSTSLAFKLDSCTMHFEPLGTVLIIAPWNYPVDLLFSPLIGAISAGNTAILKPSEVSANTARFLDEHLSRYLDPQCFAIVTGGPSETEALLDWSHWNLIFFTGSNRVGRIVQQKAAANLIPTVLELGGKSPCIVDTNVDLTVAAKRIIFGKLFNAGQTCIAPDYILTRRELVEPLVEQLIAAIKTFYGDDPSKSFDYSQIVDQAHWDRLNSLIPATEGITRVGSSNRESRYFAPTIILEPNLGDALMREEIFGPLLPIIVVDGIETSIDFINNRDKPLAIYIFSNDSGQVRNILQKTNAGGYTINDTMLHVFSGLCPLGGVGASGMGRYRGRWSFETFSHQKPVLWRSMRAEFVNDYTRNPPIDEKKFSYLSAALFSVPKSQHLP